MKNNQSRAAYFSEAAETAIKKYGMLQKNDSVIVALSGGADSTALLNFLNSIKEKYNLTLYAAHLNHGIRGEEADNDEKFCKILCENYKIKLFVKHIDIPALSAEKKISEELCGRNERYAFFEQLSSRLNAKIATAHTAGDNAETLIFNLCRGSSLAGASAIPPKRGNIIRPLIELTREDVEAYCEENSLEYVTDSTNFSDEYTRNRIRHNIIPELKSLNPSVERSLLGFSRDASEAAGFLDGCADEALNSAKEKYGYNAQTLLSQNPAVLKAAIAKICKGENAGVERRHIDLILSALKNGGAVELKNGKKAVCAQNIFRIIGEKEEKNGFFLEFNKNLTFSYLGVTYRAKAEENLLKSKKMVFRTRKSGDNFTFYKRNVTKPLRRALSEQKIPSELRGSLLLLCDGSTVLWCSELGFSKQGRKAEIEINIL